MGRKTYGEGEGDTNAPKAWEERDLKRSELFEKGQSKRIWAELYKVGKSYIHMQMGPHCSVDFWPHDPTQWIWWVPGPRTT